MIPISTRHTRSLIALLLPVTAAVLFQLYLRKPVDDCSQPEALELSIAIAGSRDGRQLRERVRGDLLHWSEGTVPVPGVDVPPLEFRILRSRDPKRLYRAPRNFLREKIEIDWTDVVRIDSAEHLLPIHVVYGHTEDVIQLGAYLFVYDGRPIENPYLQELKGALPQLIMGRGPLTLFAISGTAPGPLFDATDAVAKQWVVDAWEYYDLVCSP